MGRANFSLDNHVKSKARHAVYDLLKVEDLDALKGSTAHYRDERIVGI
jgi:hypothetical protein